jgi:caa(3)-type oxidase subunit IV
LLTSAAVLALAAGSWALAHAPLGAFAAPVALLVAALKASLVAAVFMRLWEGTTAARFAIALALGFIALLALAVVSDVVLR